MKYLEMKKRAFMSIVNAVKGFVRTVSGTPPLSLPDCVDNDSLISYSLSGNSVQNGEPTTENPIEVESVGDYDEETGKYKIPIKMSGKNLFNPEEVIAKFQSGDTYKSGSYTCTSIQLKPNTTYYMKTFNPTGGTGRFFMSANETVATSTGQTISVIDTSNHSYPRKYENSATTDDTGCLYLGYYGVGGDTERDRILRENQIQIVEGTYTATTAPDYEHYVEPIFTNIYLDEPLNSTDYINSENKKIIRNFGVMEFDENLSYAVIGNATYSFYGFYRTVQKMKQGTRQVGFCNYIKNTANDAYSNMWFGVNSKAIYFSLPDIYNLGTDSTTRIQALKDWLATLETPFLIYYPLETPIEEDIVLPKLPTLKGTTIYSIETTVQPSNMSAKYYSTSKGE